MKIWKKKATNKKRKKKNNNSRIKGVDSKGNLIENPPFFLISTTLFGKNTQKNIQTSQINLFCLTSLISNKKKSC